MNLILVIMLNRCSDSDVANKPMNNVRIKMDLDSLCSDSDDENEYVSRGKKKMIQSKMKISLHWNVSKSQG